jgi:hypothetical protein
MKEDEYPIDKEGLMDFVIGQEGPSRLVLLRRIAELEAEVERLEKEAVLASLFMDGQKDQIDQLRQALDVVIELQLLKKQSKP